MVLVNEAQGYLTCLECHDVFPGGDESEWMAIHMGDPPACGKPGRGRSHHRGFHMALPGLRRRRN